MSALEAARALARRGLPVLPCWYTDAAGRCACGAPPGDNCKPGKHPLGRLVPKGVKNASIDRSTIESWWRRWPSANVAIATGGEPSGCWWSTSTRTPAARRRWPSSRREHGALPATVEVITPRGGRHLYFIVPSGRPMPGNSAGKLGARHRYARPGRATSCAPPSTVGGRPYAWSVDSGDRIAEAPAWLLDLPGARAAATAKRPPRGVAEARDSRASTHGARNQTIARIAGLLFRRLPDPTLAAELVACFNDVKCRPPLEAAELKRTLDSIAAREMQRRGLNS